MGSRCAGLDGYAANNALLLCSALPADGLAVEACCPAGHAASCMGYGHADTQSTAHLT